VKTFKSRDGVTYKIESDIPTASTEDIKGNASEAKNNTLVLKEVVNELLDRVYKLEQGKNEKQN